MNIMKKMVSMLLLLILILIVDSCSMKGKSTEIPKDTIYVIGHEVMETGILFQFSDGTGYYIGD